MQFQRYRCDRCGTECMGTVYQEDWRNIRGHNGDLVPGRDELDLCYACMKAFRAWFEMLRSP